MDTYCCFCFFLLFSCRIPVIYDSILVEISLSELTKSILNQSLSDELGGCAVASASSVRAVGESGVEAVSGSERGEALWSEWLSESTSE